MRRATRACAHRPGSHPPRAESLRLMVRERKGALTYLADKHGVKPDRASPPRLRGETVETG